MTSAPALPTSRDSAANYQRREFAVYVYCLR
jgi:hypothetical protein